MLKLTSLYAIISELPVKWNLIGYVNSYASKINMAHAKEGCLSEVFSSAILFRLTQSPGIKKLFLLMLFMLSFIFFTKAQVTVTGAHSSSNGTYTTVKDAFDAINAQTQTGNTIVLTVTAGTTETASAVLNAGAWTSLTMYPTTSGLTISGTLAGAPVIDLNGADNVTIDGRVNATGTTVDLVITNTSTSATAGTSTIRFINDACSNTVQYCLIEGSSTDASAGIIFFSTSSSGGNDNNSISNNNITADVDANRPLNAIFSLGSASNDNNGNSISNNNIYNFFSRSGASSQGILLSSNTTAWVINGNSFYETASFTPTATTPYSVIYINNASGISFRVNDNYIGGSAASCGGSAWTKIGSGSGVRDNPFYAIRCNVGSSDSSRIYNNRIQNWSWGNSAASAWYGIAVEAGQVNIGNSGGNWIGDTTGTGNITYTAGQSSGGAGNFYGIHISGANNVSIRNNLMGSITTANGSGSLSTSFYGINKTAVAGTLTIVNNTIGSRATANSIRCSSTSTGFTSSAQSTQVLYGIYSVGTGVHTVDANTISRLTNSTTNTSTSFQGVVRGVHISGHASGSTITNNIVQHLTIANVNTSSTGGGVVGIFASNSSTTCTISGNLIHSIFNSNVDFTGQVCAIYFYGLNNQNSNIRNNFIYNIYTASINGTPSVFGINCFRSDVIVSNNIISLSSNSRAHFYGIRTDNESFSSDGSILFNTVYLSGTQSVASTINSRCIWLSGSSGSSTAHYVNNNILHNTRTNSGSATGVHAAVHFDFSTNAFCNYNNYFVNGTGGVVGYWPSANRTTLADLQTANSQDASSTNVNVVFTNAGGTTPGSYLPTTAAANLVLVANRLTSITTDYTGATRTFYSMGAYDFAVNQPVVQVTATVGTASANYSSLKLALDAVNAGTHQGVVEVKITTSLTDNQSAILYQSGYNGTSSYTTLAIYPTAADLVYEVSLAGALLDLNGADNVTLDGRVNRTGSSVALTFTNTSISSSANTIRFINGAQSNTIRYTALKGASTGGSTGLINFSTSTSGANSSNIIEYCSISGLNSASRPRHVIYSFGSASPNGNNNNTIRNNEISHFFIADGLGGDVTAVGVYSNSSAWTITDNSFFLPSTISLFNGTYHVIYINNNTGVNFQVNNNFIGGTSANCGGGTFTITSGKNFYGIRLNVGTSTASNIQGNTFKKISYSADSYKDFILIEAAGTVNIGTTTGNILGDSTTTGSIVFDRGYWSSTPQPANFFGINILMLSGTVNCQNNIVAGINIGPANYNQHVNFVGIRNTGSSSTISNNKIGSFNTANSINIMNTAEVVNTAQTVDGILSTTSATINDNLISNLKNGTINTNTSDAGRINGIRCTAGNQTMLRNTVRNLSIANTNAASTQDASVGGIIISGAGAHTLTSNIISGLTNSQNNFAGTIHGIYLVGSSSSSSITRNFIQGLTLLASGANPAAATLYGIRHVSGQVTYTNNIVAFGNNSPGILYGIYDAGAVSSALNLYHNTVYLAGSPATGAHNSFAFYSNAANSARNIRNNIFSNARSNNLATGTHYAAFFNYGVSTSLTLDYNDYFAGGSGGVIGRYNSADVSTVPIIATFDANSRNLNPSFSLAGGVRPTDYKTLEKGLVGIPITGITTDFANTTRSYYSMGAYDQPVFSVWTGAVSTVWTATGNWSTGVVPPASPEIQFSPTASRNLVLDANRTVKAIYFNGSSRNLVLGNFNLTVDSIITGGTASSYVQTNGTGILTKSIANASSFNFPVGNAAYNPVSITNNTGASDAFSLRILNEVYYRGTAGNVAKEPRVSRTWLIDKVNPNGGSGVDFQFNWNSGEMTTGVNAPRMYHYNGNIWDKQTGSTSSTSTSLTYTGYTGTFSPFTIGDDLSILPVTWLHLNCARKSSNAVMLNWATAEEKDASHFEIQRMTDTGYRSIGRVNAVGNSLSPNHYRFVDAAAPEIASLYRVLQKDANGDFSFSPGCMASASTFSAENRLFYVTPVPADDALNVFTPFDGEEIEYSLINAAGMNALNGKSMKRNIQINTAGLNNGLYLLRVKTAEGIRQIRVVISHH